MLLPLQMAAKADITFHIRLAEDIQHYGADIEGP